MIYTMTETFTGGGFVQWYNLIEDIANIHHIKRYNPEYNYYDTLFLPKLDEISEFIKKEDLLIIDSEYFNPNLTQDTIIHLSNSLVCDVIVIHKDSANIVSYKNVHVNKPVYNLKQDTLDELSNRFNFYLVNAGLNKLNNLSYDIYKLFYDNNKVKKFLCTNGCEKPHRTVLYHLLKKYNILENSFYSYSLHATDSETISEVFGDEFDVSNDISDLPLFADFNHNHPSGNPFSHFIPLTLSSNCVFEIVSCTKFSYTGSILTSEKIFRPFVSFLFPIYVGQYGICDLLRKMNFDLFDDIIDHSYDLEQDDTIRMKMVTSEIKRLNEISDDELYKTRIYHKTKLRLENNFKLLSELAYLQIETLFNFNKYR